MASDNVFEVSNLQHETQNYSSKKQSFAFLFVLVQSRLDLLCSVSSCVPFL